jgi:hypothetical protein
VGGGDLFEALTGADVLNETSKAFVPAHCAGTGASAMRAKCDTEEQKLKVHNHLSLNSAVSLKLYMWSIPIWAILRTFHDWLIIWEMHEFFSLIVGYLSALPQFLSVASGFLWCIGAAEVFRTTDNGHCPCYFEMDTMAMFAVIATPVGLYMLTQAKVSKLGYATLHGDFLYTVSYDVPYRVAARSNSDPTYDFLSVEDNHGPRSVWQDLAGRDLGTSQYRILGILYDCLVFIWNLVALYFVYSFAFPALTVRFYNAVLVDVVNEGLKFVYWGMVLFGCAALAGPFFVYYKQLQRIYNLIHKLCESRCNEQNSEQYHALSWMSCYKGPIYVCAKVIQSLFMLLLASKSFKLVYLLGHGQTITATSAGDVGAGGFFILVAVLNSWVPSDTDPSALRTAIKIKGGVVPWDGIRGITKLHDQYKHLGLHTENRIANAFLKKGDYAYTQPFWCLSDDVKREWEQFYHDRL